LRRPSIDNGVQPLTVIDYSSIVNNRTNAMPLSTSEFPFSTDEDSQAE
jgi:hypothetical protein